MVTVAVLLMRAVLSARMSGSGGVATRSGRGMVFITKSDPLWAVGADTSTLQNVLSGTLGALTSTCPGLREAKAKGPTTRADGRAVTASQGGVAAAWCSAASFSTCKYHHLKRAPVLCEERIVFRVSLLALCLPL